MANFTLSQSLELAKRHEAAGRAGEAENIYRQILIVQPDQVDVLYSLGVLLGQTGRSAESMGLLQRAVQLNPSHFLAWSILSGLLFESGRLDDAIFACRKVTEIRPRLAMAHSNLSLLLGTQGKPDEAIVSAKNALALRPDLAEAHNHLGIALMGKSLFGDAASAFAAAIKAKRDYVQAMGNLSSVLRSLRKIDDAIAMARKAIGIDPGNAEAHNHLGAALLEKHETTGAIAALTRAVELKPDYAEAYNNLGNALAEISRFDDAIAAYRKAVSIKPGHPEIHKNLGSAFKQQGLLAEAIQSWRTAIALNPKDSAAHSSLVFALHYLPEYGAGAILQEHRLWADRFEKPLVSLRRPHANDRSPERRLKVGYVSADFRDHPVGRQLAPLLAHHDHGQFETFCYSNVQKEDAVTSKLRKLADNWRPTADLSDAELAEKIRADGIDLLVDTGLHTENNRLLVFARKPAPVQITAFGYPETTGLTAIDYRITDPFLDPPAQHGENYSEKSVRLRHSFWCFQAPADSPEPNALPALDAGYVTFGCLNNFSKVSGASLELWREILRSLPNSRLILRCPVSSSRDRILKLFGSGAIDGGRIEFVDTLSSADYFRLYHRLDLCLDPFPYPGHTSSLDGLWMGVPAITLVGSTAISRGGASILANSGLSEFIAYSPGQYVEIARRQSVDLPALAQLRARVRGALKASPLMEEGQFAASFESCYREMWRKWCAR